MPSRGNLRQITDLREYCVKSLRNLIACLSIKSHNNHSLLVIFLCNFLSIISK